MKKITALLLVIITVFGLCACSSQSMKDAKDSESYRENVVDFNLYVPESWIINEKTASAAAYVFSSWKKENGAWVIVDYSNVIVHIFTRDARDFYKLDKLYAD